MSENKHKGDKAEVSFLKVAIFKQWTIATPFSEENRYDFLVDKGEGRIDRVQVKYARPDSAGDTMVFNTASVGRNRDGRCYRTPYSESEVDVIVAYYEPLDKCFYVPLSNMKAGQKEMRLRFTETKNNQEDKINWAEDYLLEV